MRTERSTKRHAPRYCVSLFIMSAWFLLQGSSCSPKPAPMVRIDQALMQPCAPIPLIQIRPDGQIEMGELLLADIELAGLYKECARGKEGLIEAVEQRPMLESGQQ